MSHTLYVLYWIFIIIDILYTIEYIYIYIYIYIPCLRFFSVTDYKILNMVPCAIQEDLAVYLFYT